MVLQVRALLRELRDALPALLGGRRAGVAAALLAAAGRCGSAPVQVDAARALSSALAARASAGGAAAEQQVRRAVPQYPTISRVLLCASSQAECEKRSLEPASSVNTLAGHPDRRALCTCRCAGCQGDAARGCMHAKLAVQKGGSCGSMADVRQEGCASCVRPARRWRSEGRQTAPAAPA